MTRYPKVETNNEEFIIVGDKRRRVVALTPEIRVSFVRFCPLRDIEAVIGGNRMESERYLNGNGLFLTLELPFCLIRLFTDESDYIGMREDQPEHT